MAERIVGRYSRAAIDLISIVLGLYGSVFCFYLVLPPHLAAGGHWQFLTNISLAVAMVVFVLSFLAHIIKSEKLFILKNTIHPIALTLELIVTITYWPLRIFFLNLLATDPKKELLPMSVDLSLHLMPVFSLLIDYLIYMPRWTIPNSTAFIICITLTSSYWYLLKQLVDLENGGKYPYAFLNTETEQERIVIFLIVGLVAFIQIPLMKFIYDKIVGITVDLEEEVDKKNK